MREKREMREMEMYAHDGLTTARKDAEYGNTAADTEARRSPNTHHHWVRCCGMSCLFLVKVRSGTTGTISQEPWEKKCYLARACRCLMFYVRRNDDR